MYCLDVRAPRRCHEGLTRYDCWGGWEFLSVVKHFSFFLNPFNPFDLRTLKTTAMASSPLANHAQCCSPSSASQGPCSPNMITMPGSRDLQRACTPCLAIVSWSREVGESFRQKTGWRWPWKFLCQISSDFVNFYRYIQFHWISACNYHRSKVGVGDTEGHPTPFTLCTRSFLAQVLTAWRLQSWGAVAR